MPTNPYRAVTAPTQPRPTAPGKINDPKSPERFKPKPGDRPRPTIKPGPNNPNREISPKPRPAPPPKADPPRPTIKPFRRKVPPNNPPVPSQPNPSRAPKTNPPPTAPKPPPTVPKPPPVPVKIPTKPPFKLPSLPRWLPKFPKVGPAPVPLHEIGNPYRPLSPNAPDQIFPDPIREYDRLTEDLLRRRRERERKRRKRPHREPTPEPNPEPQPRPDEDWERAKEKWRPTPRRWNPSDRPWSTPWKIPVPDFPIPDPDPNPYPRPWSTPEEQDEYWRRWERPNEGDPDSDSQPEENPYDGPIWSPTGRADDPETCWTAIMYEDPSNKRDWGWIAFQFGGALIGDRINARAWNMGDHTLLPEYQMSDWEMSRLKNSPPVLVSDGFSNTGGQSWIVQLAGMGGNLTKKPNEPIRFNLLGNNENKSYTIEGASYAKGNHYDWKMMVVCPSDTRPRLPEPENPEPEDDDMSCRYLKDQQQIVTVDVFDEKTGNFIPTKIRAHEAMIDVPKYLSEEMKKINKRLDAIFKTLEAGELQSQNGMLFDPKEQIAISKDVIAKNKAVRARTRRDIEVAIASQNGDAIAAVPEWWANRVGSNRPQLIVQYAEKLLNGSYGPAHYAITIPHYDNKKQENKDPDITNFSDYEKGSFMAICTMPDNSKLLVNCKTADEGRRTIGMLIKTTKFQLDDCELTISERKGQSLKETRVYPRVLKYFSQGQKDPKPDWIYYFK